MVHNFLYPRETFSGVVDVALTYIMYYLEYTVEQVYSQKEEDNETVYDFYLICITIRSFCV